MSANPTLKAVIIESGTIPGEFSLRAVRGGKQVPIQLVVKEAGFVPGDIVYMCLLENVVDPIDQQEMEESIREEYESQISEYEAEISVLERKIDDITRTIED